MKTPFLGAATAAVAFLLVSPAPVHAQTVVDHTNWQTELRDQGARTTCITFAAIAALEARYKRIGQELDLSEEFLNYMRKMFWLHPDWTDIAAGGADECENQLGTTGGGSGVSVAEWLANGFAVPDEDYWPYQETNYNNPYPWDHAHWDSQYNTNTLNLDPDRLPRAALNAPGYYYATSFYKVQQPNSPSAIEAVLQAGYEVVWDFHVNGDRSGPIWHASSVGDGGGHSMLIVGYNRQSSNPLNHYFICKNSWGPTSNPGGYTYIGYDYIQYGYNAGYISSVAPNARPWPELKFIGRRTISYDGWPGTLDVYHLPGINQMHLDQLANGITDRRVGTFYDHNGVAHRVNGTVYGNTLHFWWKSGNKNMRWDEERETPTLGRSFIYRTVTADGDQIAGRHHDNAGLTPNPAYGGFAVEPTTMTSNDGLPQIAPPPPANEPEQYLGSWLIQTGGYLLNVRFTHRDDSVLSAWQQLSQAAIIGTATYGSTTAIPITMRVNKFSPREMLLAFNHPVAGLVDLQGWMLTWRRGAIAGLADVDQSTEEAFYMWRTGNFEAGSKTPYGQECGPVNYAPYHHVVGHPEVGRALWFQSSNLQPNDIGLVAIGLSSSLSGGVQLPASLAGIGMPGCHLYVDPVLTDAFIANSSGQGYKLHIFGNHLLGADLYSQIFLLMPGANAAGLVASNGVHVHLGGTW